MKRVRWSSILIVLFTSWILVSIIVYPALASEHSVDYGITGQTLFMDDIRTTKRGSPILTQNLISEPFILNAEIIWEMTYPSQSLLRDEDTLWVGSHYGGLYKWDTTFGYQGSYTTTVGQDIVDLAQLGNGNIVAAALDGGLVAGNSQFTDITPSGLQTPWDLAVESDGTSYWVATRGQGIFHYQNDAWITYTTPAIPSNYVHAIALDSNDDPWIGTLGYGLATLAVVRCSSSSKSLAVAGLLTVPLSANKLFSSHSLLLEPMGKKSMNREPRLWLSV